VKEGYLGGSRSPPANEEELVLMGETIGEMLPLSVGIAISLTTIITTFLMLLSPKAKGRSVALLIGCVVGVAGAVALFAWLSALLPTHDSDRSSPTAGVIKLVGGVVLVLLAARQWRHRPSPGEEPELPTWMAGVDSMPPVKALGLGLVLTAVVPKNLLIALAAGVILGEAGLRVGQTAVVILLFTVIATSTVAIPVVAHLVASARMSGHFDELRRWLVRNSVAIMVIVLLVIGIVMIGNGIASL
jgi:threonine/homoserine/homoserine lactone efflux protein